MPHSEPSRHNRAAGTYAKGEQRKALIVTTALDIFASGGYVATSMAQIARAAGVSRAGLSHHFPTKESLLAAVLEERDRLDDERFFAPADPDHPLELATRLCRLVRHNARQPELVRLFASLSAESSAPGHPARRYFAVRYARTRRDFRHAIDAFKRAGLLDESVPTADLAAELVAFIDGLQVQWLLDPARVDMERLVRRRLEELVSTPIPA